MLKPLASSSQDFELSAWWESPALGLLELRAIRTKEAASYPFQDFCPSRAKEPSQLLSHFSKCITGKGTTPSVTASGGDRLDRTANGLSTAQESKSQTKPIPGSSLCSDSQLFCFSLLFSYKWHYLVICASSLLFHIILDSFPGNKQDSFVSFWWEIHCFLLDNHIFGDICRCFYRWIFSISISCFRITQRVYKTFIGRLTYFWT